MKHFFAILSVFAVSANALPAIIPHVIHEKRTGGASWSEVANIKPDGRTILPVRIGLRQNNLDRGHDVLMDISSPTSENYGKHLSADEIAEMFSPSTASLDAVQAWLVASGIDPSRLALSPGRHWLKFSASVAEVESLLKTEYKFYKHSSGQAHVACEDYSVPKELREHIDLIMPTVHFDTKIVSKPDLKRKRRDIVGRPLPGAVDNVSFMPKQGKRLNETSYAVSSGYTLSNCNQYITPDCLRALYSLPNGTLAQSSYAVVEYTPQAYLQSDLNMFYSNVAAEIPQGTGPILASVDGGVVQTSSQSFGDNGESDLDLQYAIALVYPQKVTLYQTGDTGEGGSFNTFLDAIDASYCTYEGGDDAAEGDPTYPDSNPGGYEKHDCGRYTPASVISTSYGSDEADLTAAYEERQCNEYMKLGMQGVTVLYSSGDYGVAGNPSSNGVGRCCTKKNCAGGTFNNGGTGTFNPSFPGTCPYVTSVGATQIKPGASVTAPEEACQTVIYSGGGFSNIFPLPSYQADAVGSYLSNHQPNYTATQYNNSGKVRGYPDVSANGANYVVAVDGMVQTIYGTSASSPTFGSVVTLINEQRAAANKSPVGFLNPTLYANPGMMNDITTGGNPGCGTPGFTAVEGWDPVTGLGTPNYEKMLSVFMGLP